MAIDLKPLAITLSPTKITAAREVLKTAPSNEMPTANGDDKEKMIGLLPSDFFSVCPPPSNAPPLLSHLVLWRHG